jgi:hypothetical protein
MRNVIMTFLVLIGTTAGGWLPAGAEEVAARGFFYGGFQPSEHPFQQPGQQYWVASTGDDASAGTADQPWKTLTHAAQTIQGGDVVTILPGFYVFDGRFGPAGPNPDKKTVFRAADISFRSGRVVISADEKFTSPTWSLADNVSIQGLWIGGDYANAHQQGGGSYSSRHSEIVGCTFFNSGGFAGGPAYNWLFQNNRMVHQGKGTHGHSMYMAGGIRHDLPWNSRNLRVLGNTIIAGEGYAFHCWHSPVSATIAGNFCSGNYWSIVLQGPNHSCHHNVFWKPRGNVGGADSEVVGFNGWLPARLRRFDHLIFGSPHPVWQRNMPPIRARHPIKRIYLLYDARIHGVPDDQHFLLSGQPWTGTLELPTSRAEAATVPPAQEVVRRPAFFPRSAAEIDDAIQKISKYFQQNNPRQISQDQSGLLEKLFEVLEIQYHTTSADYACFPPMAQDKDDGTYGKH